mmetsp:Transcript_3262/g.6145  ORF Transcript_3262/g.6145 Transcript_3262/m.6145 type:complete len:106 (-) Transcript_3262:3128-3445(-)
MHANYPNKSFAFCAWRICLPLCLNFQFNARENGLNKDASNFFSSPTRRGRYWAHPQASTSSGKFRDGDSSFSYTSSSAIISKEAAINSGILNGEIMLCKVATDTA